MVRAYKNAALLLVASSAISLTPVLLWADTFGTGENAFDIEFVSVPSVGQHTVRPCGRCEPEIVPGNRPDNVLSNIEIGGVPYGYRIGKFEVSEAMIDAANALGGLGITKDTRGPDKPATSITWIEAAQFVNWLNEDQGFAKAYKIDENNLVAMWEPGEPGYNAENSYRNSLARYVLPTTDEWHKAAYYDVNEDFYYRYPTGPAIPTSVISGTDPGTAVFRIGSFNVGPANIMEAGGLSPYGTMAQGGNVSEWLENPGSDRGGSWRSGLNGLVSNRTGLIGSAEVISFDSLGFRVAAVPEPATGCLVVLAVTPTLVRGRGAMKRLSR